MTLKILLAVTAACLSVRMFAPLGAQAQIGDEFNVKTALENDRYQAAILQISKDSAHARDRHEDAIAQCQTFQPGYGPRADPECRKQADTQYYKEIEQLNSRRRLEDTDHTNKLRELELQRRLKKRLPKMAPTEPPQPEAQKPGQSELVPAPNAQPQPSSQEQATEMLKQALMTAKLSDKEIANIIPGKNREEAQKLEKQRHKVEMDKLAKRREECDTLNVELPWRFDECKNKVESEMALENAMNQRLLKIIRALPAGRASR